MIGRKKVRRLMLAAVLLVLMAWVGYLVVTDRRVTAEDENAVRDPATGWRIGMGERELGEKSASGAVLMVHGFIGGWNNFHTLPEQLEERGWFVRMMRLPGHGTSPRDYAVTTPDELQGAVVSELAKLKQEHESVVVVGHSMGSALSTLAVSELGADRLVLGAPYFGVTHKWFYGLRPETWTKVLDPLIDWVYKGELFVQVNRPEAKSQIATYTWVPVSGLVTLQQVGERVNDTAMLSKVDCPVLMVHSKGDAAASFEAARSGFERLGSKEKKGLWLERSNHHVYWDWDREQVFDEILEFIGDAPQGETQSTGERQ